MKTNFFLCLIVTLLFTFCAKSPNAPDVNNIYKTYNFEEGQPSYTIVVDNEDSSVTANVFIAPCHTIPHVTVDGMSLTPTNLSLDKMTLELEGVPKKNEYTFIIEMDSLFSSRVVKRALPPASVTCGNKNIAINAKTVRDTIQKQTNTTFTFAGGHYTRLSLSYAAWDSLWEYSYKDTVLRGNTIIIPTRNFMGMDIDVTSIVEDTLPAGGDIQRQGDFLSGFYRSTNNTHLRLFIE